VNRAFYLVAVLIAGCGWSARDRDNFMAECVATDSKTTCDCGLVVAQRHFKSFDEFYKNRDDFPRSMELELGRECKIGPAAPDEAKKTRR
jgi:hypothetical protein